MIVRSFLFVFLQFNFKAGIYTFHQCTSECSCKNRVRLAQAKLLEKALQEELEVQFLYPPSPLDGRR